MRRGQAGPQSGRQVPATATATVMLTGPETEFEPASGPEPAERQAAYCRHLPEWHLPQKSCRHQPQIRTKMPQTQTRQQTGP